MTKHEMTKQFLAAQEAVSKAKEALEKATDDLKRVKKQIEEMAKAKPKMFFNGNRPTWALGCIPEIEITKYHKYSDEYVEFVTQYGRFRYIKTYTTTKCKFPSPPEMTFITNAGYIFERYDCLNRRYMAVDYIDHIELLEGVDEYDNSRCNH